MGGLELLNLANWSGLQRRVLLVICPLGTLASLAALWVERADMDVLDRWALPLLGSTLMLLGLLLLARRISPEATARGVFIAASLYFLLGLERQFQWFVPHYGMLSESSYWFAALYSLAFLAFRPRVAVTACVVIFGVSLLVCGANIAALAEGGALRGRTVGSVSQFLLSSALLVLAQVGVSALRRQYDQMHAAAYLDLLTGLPNRRYAQTQLDALLAQPRTGAARALTVVLLDIDHFKRVNDTYGHEAGDDVLRETARVVSRHLHGEQVLTRWGGEEFLLILPGLNMRGGKALAERAREELYRHVFESVGGLTASFGVAERVAGEPLDALLRRADAALYAAKRQGRNGVRVAMEDGRLTRLDAPGAVSTEPQGVSPQPSSGQQRVFSLFGPRQRLK